MSSFFKKLVTLAFGKNKVSRAFFSGLSALIVFCVTYSLILPAITLDSPTAEESPGIEIEDIYLPEEDIQTEDGMGDFGDASFDTDYIIQDEADPDVYFEDGSFEDGAVQFENSDDAILFDDENDVFDVAEDSGDDGVIIDEDDVVSADPEFDSDDALLPGEDEEQQLLIVDDEVSGASFNCMIIRQGSDGSYYAMASDGAAVPVTYDAETDTASCEDYSGLIWTRTGNCFTNEGSYLDVTEAAVGYRAVTTEMKESLFVDEEEGKTSVYTKDIESDETSTQEYYNCLVMSEDETYFTVIRIDTVPVNRVIFAEAAAGEEEAAVEEEAAAAEDEAVEDAEAAAEDGEAESFTEEVVAEDTESIVEEAAAAEDENSAVESEAEAAAEQTEESIPASETEADVESTVEEVVTSETEPAAAETAEAETESMVEEVAEAETESMVEEVAEAETESMVEEVAEVETESMVEEMAEAETESMVEDMATFSTESMVEDMATFSTESMVEEIACISGEMTHEGADYTVTVTVDESAGIPANAALKVQEILPGTAEYDEYYAQAAGVVADNDETVSIGYARFFDICFVVQEFDEYGECVEREIEPESGVDVKISYKTAAADSAESGAISDTTESAASDAQVSADPADVNVLHFKEGNIDVVPDISVDQVSENETVVSFESNSFSVYGIVGTETLTERVITANGESFTIEVTYGPEAEIPSGARLEAREILEGTEEYQKYIDQAKEAMTMAPGSETEENTTIPEGEDPKKADDNEGSVDPDEPITAARFFDINIYVGEEKIEPKAPVQVNIKYDDAIQLNENELLKAVHFASTGTDLISVDVVETKDGITEVSFEQDSFSVTGTVVQYLSTGWPDNGDYVMIVKPYNSNNYYAVKNNGEITSVNYNGNTGKVTFSDFTSVDQVDDYWWTKSDYSSNWKYLRAKNSPQNYLDPNEADALATSSDSVRRTTNGNVYNQDYYYGQTVYNYLLVNENSLQIEGQGNYDSANRAVIFFANDFTVDEVPEPTEDPTEVDLGAPGTGKTITPNNDGTYQLALSVTGKSQAQETHTTADVLVIFDTSGSMTSSRMTTAKSAMRTLANALLTNNTEEYPDTVRLKLIPFASVTRSKTDGNPPTYYNDFAWVTGSGSGTNFNNGYSTFNNQLGQLSSSGSGGTNWEDALQDAKDVSMRSDAAKYVIFVSDGNPTFRNTKGQNDWNDNNNTYQNRYDHTIYGTGSDSNSTTVSRCYQMARDDAKALVDAGINFYTIGVFGSVDRMNNLTAYAYSGSDSGTYPTGRYQSADADNIDQVFANIIDDINKNFSYTDVEIDDGITALTATALVTGTVNNYEYKITYVDAVDNQTHTVNATKNADGTLTIPSVTYNIKNADGSTKSVTTTAVTVKGATYDGEKVTWELDKSDGTNYKLENGWTYEVSFTVWPTQRAYDLIADLANGNVTYASLSDEEKASIDQATLTLKTNSEASVTYRQITTTNGVDGTPSDPKTVGIDNPPGVPLAGSDLKIVKRWNDDLDPTQLLDLLTDHLNAAGTDVDYTVTLDVVQDKGTSAEEHVHTADYPDGFVYKPNVTIADGKVTAATWPEIDIAVAPGIMVTYEHAHAHGFDTAVDSEGNPKYRTIEFEGVTYYIIEEGHRYEITERAVDYHFEMMTDIDHLMIIDGVLKNVVHNDDGSIKEISQNPGNLTELGATNSLKGGINLYKYVEDTNGNKITPKDDVFTVKCKLVDEEGNAYTRSSETVGDDESDGIVYRAYAPDSELATVYPGKVETGRNRTIKIGVLNSSEFTVQLKAGWQIRFINVPSNTHWEFEEINIPTGYKLDTTGTEQVDGHTVPKTRGMTGIALTNTANDAQITNTMEDFETRILKIETGTGTKDSETGEYTTEPVKLDGVKFIVKNNNEGDDNGKYLVLTDGEISWSSTKSEAYEFTTANGGIVSFGSLPLGKYLLTETETKAGYNLLTEDISIEVTADGVNYQINSTAQPQKATKKTVTEDGKTVIYCQIEVPNSAGVTLPNTGGPGTLPYTLGGIVLMLGVALMYGFRMRRRERRYN